MKRLLSRLLYAVLCVAVAEALFLAGAASAYSPDTSPRFNSPRPAGNPNVYRIVDHLRAAIGHVPAYTSRRPRPEIDIATYSHNLPQVNDALIAAHRRAGRLGAAGPEQQRHLRRDPEADARAGNR